MNKVLKIGMGCIGCLCISILSYGLSVDETVVGHAIYPNPSIAMTGSWPISNLMMNTSISDTHTETMTLSNGYNRTIAINVVATGDWCGLTLMNLNSDDGATSLNSELPLNGTVLGYTGTNVTNKSIVWTMSFGMSQHPTMAGNINGTLTFTVTALS